MNLNTDNGATAPTHPYPPDLAVQLSAFESLGDEITAAGLSRDTLSRALDTRMSELTTQLRAVPATEGKLLERGIALAAAYNPNLIILTQNLRLPATKAASEPVEMKDRSLYRSLSLDADSGGASLTRPTC